MSSPRPRSSSILSIADSAASTSPSNSSSPRATRASSSALPGGSSYRNFLGSSRSTERLAPSSPSHQRPYSMAGSGPSSSSSSNATLTGHDPHLTPTPSSRKQSLSSSSSMTSIASAASGGSSSSASRGPRLGASDYRYSLGPAPVRFPKEAGGSRRGSGIADVGPALLSASPTAPSASAARRQRTPSPRASRSRTTSSSSQLIESSVAGQGGAEYGEEEEDQEVTPRPTRPHSRLAPTSTTGAAGGVKSDTDTPGNPSLLDIDKRFSTRTSSSATLRGNYASASGGHEHGAMLGSSAASSSSSTHLQRPGMPPRPSSKVLTTFPFPHPTTPRGTTDEEGRTLPNLLGFSWVSKIFGTSGASGQDKEGGEAATRAAEQQEGERRGLLASQQDQQQQAQVSGPLPRSSRVVASYGAVPSASPRPRSDYQQHGAQYAAAAAGASGASQQPRRNPSLSSLTTSEPDPSDPYGYRRLAGPDLLPTYHAEHVNPRRRKRELQRRWEKRRKIWMVVGAVLLFCGLLFVGAKALDTMRSGSGGESEEGGDGGGGGGGGGPPGDGGGERGGDQRGGEDGGVLGSLASSVAALHSTRAMVERSSGAITVGWQPPEHAR